jgi:hypothetical protein
MLEHLRVGELVAGRRESGITPPLATIAARLAALPKARNGMPGNRRFMTRNIAAIA